MSERRPETTGRRSGGVLMILAILLLLAAVGGLGWLHFAGRLQPLIAGGPRIEVELPATMAMPDPETVEAGSAPVAEAELAPAPAPEDAAGEVEHAAPGHAAPVPVESVPAEPVPAPEPPANSTASSTTDATADAPAGSTLSGEVPPPEAAPETAAPETAASETAEEQIAEAPAPVPTPETAPEETAAEDSAPAETPAAEAPAVDEPPPPAPPAPELPPESTAESTAEPAPAAETAPADAAESGDATAPAEGEAPPENPQVAAATVPPGTVPAWQRLARPFPDDETRPRIAVVVAGLGLSEAATTAAIQQLPAEITLSFSPYSNRIEEWVAMARAAGHEVLIDLPLEPASFPRDDPGPQALLTSLGEETNAERLAWVLSRVEGFVGVATFMGSRFTTSAEHMQPVVEELARRGLLILDSRSAADSLAAKLADDSGVAYVINDRFLDNEASRVAIDGRLQQVERIARTQGVAVAMGYAYPVTVERLTAWARGLDAKGLTLAPISAVADRQEVR